MKKREIYSGLHKGVHFEICKGEMMGKDTWTFYLYLRPDQMPEASQPLFWLDPIIDTMPGSGREWVHHNYSASAGINAIDFHCGCTWYSKEHGFEGGEKIVKIGCDFQHYWDEGRSYCLEGVESEAKQAIDSFWEYMPDYKVHCTGNGKYYQATEGTFKDGYFRSNEYDAKCKAELAAKEPK